MINMNTFQIFIKKTSATILDFHKLICNFAEIVEDTWFHLRKWNDIICTLKATSHSSHPTGEVVGSSGQIFDESSTKWTENR